MNWKLSHAKLRVCFLIITPLVFTGAVDVLHVSTVITSQAGIGLDRVVGRLVQPLYLTHAGDGSGRLFIVEQSGRIRLLELGAASAGVFLDIRSRVSRQGNERGLLGLAFHPQYADNGRLFVDYTRQPDGATLVAEYRVSATDPNRAQTEETVLLVIPQPFSNHNGGQLAFGPDGFLYINTGDGGSGGDPRNNGQNVNSLLGKILRIDVDAGLPFGIPPTNPFVGRSGRDEIWAYGLRNPWRSSFDRETGDLYIADVGQDRWEEIDVQPADSPGGENYGWRLMEGLHCFNPSVGCNQTGLTLPVHEYPHDSSLSQFCEGSVTGGYVYRGSQMPELVGTYIYGDFCQRTIWGLRQVSPGVWENAVLLQTDLDITSFGEDESGEIYVVDRGGDAFRIVSAQ